MKAPTESAKKKYSPTALEWLAGRDLTEGFAAVFRAKAPRRFDSEPAARDCAQKNKGGVHRRWMMPGKTEVIFFDELLPIPADTSQKKHTGIECEDRKWPRSLGRAVALELIEILSPVCERIEIAGSIRRDKPQVGDVELLYIPKVRFSKTSTKSEIGEIPETDAVIEAMIADGTLAKRLNSKRRTTWGAVNKLAAHVDTGMAVDLFATTPGAWWNAMVCRTGGAETNKKLAQSAIANGRNWNVYGKGVTLADGSIIRAESEEHVFELCGVPFLKPEERQ